MSYFNLLILKTTNELDVKQIVLNVLSISKSVGQDMSEPLLLNCISTADLEKDKISLYAEILILYIPEK